MLTIIVMDRVHAKEPETLRNTHFWMLFSFLAVQLVLLAIIATHYFPTRNEVAHLPAGVSHWNPGVFSFYRANPPLWRMLAVLPVLTLSPNVSGISLPTEPTLRTEWESSRTFAKDNMFEYWRMVKLSRLAGISLTLLCGILIYAWARALFGKTAGLIGLSLWCFDPNVLGHGSLLTPDMPLTLATFGSTFLFWKYLRRPTWDGALLCGIILGITQLTKFTALLLFGIWPVLLLAHVVASRRSSRSADSRRSMIAFIMQNALIVVSSVVVINMGYVFDSPFRPLRDFQFASRILRGNEEAGENAGNRFRESWIGEMPVPLPVEYVQGIDTQTYDFEREFKSYLGGEIQRKGWWYYYLYGFAVKVPVGTIALVAGTAVLTLLRWPQGTRWVDDLFLWLPPIIIFSAASSQTGFSHHFRYVLPIFPFLFVAISRVGCLFETAIEPLRGGIRAFRKPRLWACGIVLGLLAWSTVSSLRVFPHSLSYFNELVGGPENGHYHLIDSNIDWGQDLWFLKDWVDGHPESRPLFLAYYNYIDHKLLTKMDFPLPPRIRPLTVRPGNQDALPLVGPQPGYFAIDVHSLKLGPYSYFERFQPIAKAGYSIFIYHLTLETANAARRDMGLPLLEQQP